MHMCVKGLALFSVLWNDKHILLPCDKLLFQFCTGTTGDLVTGTTESLQSSLVGFLCIRGKERERCN